MFQYYLVCLYIGACEYMCTDVHWCVPLILLGLIYHLCTLHMYNVMHMCTYISVLYISVCHPSISYMNTPYEGASLAS